MSYSVILSLFRKTLPFILYLALVFLAMPKIISWPNRLIFLGYAVFIFWAIYNKMGKGNDSVVFEGKIKWVGMSFFILSIFFLLMSRLIMFIRYGEAPLGYDTGIYLQYIHGIALTGTISEAAFSVGFLPYASWFPFLSLDLPPLTILHLTHILHQFLTAGAVYFLLRSFYHPSIRQSAALIALFFFATSINQFMAFWWMFYKQSMAIPFLLIALGLFIRRSWLAIPVAGFGAVIHLQSFIPLVISFFVFLIYQFAKKITKKEDTGQELRRLLWGGFAILLLIIILKGPRELSFYFEHFTQLKGFAINAPSWQIAQEKGLFIPFSTFRLNMLFYIPFLILGIMNINVWLWRAKEERRGLIMILFAVLLILSSFSFIYQNRSLVLLDLIMIIFTAYSLVYFTKHFWTTASGKVILGLFLFGSLTFTSLFVWNFPPQVYPQELEEIKSLGKILKEEKNAYAMVTSAVYTPWVAAFAEQPPIAPGSFDLDKWTLPMWREFWQGSDNERRHNLLQMYGNRPLYFFVGEHHILHPELKKFIETDIHFVKISPRVWKYFYQK